MIFFIIECVYQCSRVTLLGTSIDRSSYVSSLGRFILCIHFCHMFWEWDEWPSLRSSGSSSIPSLHSLLTWLPCIFDLSGSSLILVFCASSSSSFSLLIHHFHSTFYSFSYSDPFSGLILSLHDYTSHYQFDLFHLSPHRHYVHIRHHWVPGSWDLLYLLHFIHEGMGFWSSGIWA